ncbi:hypothetical protein [Roseivirga sp.]|uniref:hypothetical protein n=1 Tax=Roseivirga sp. TaxID=1964215 RepID=UPI003BAB4D2C
MVKLEKGLKASDLEKKDSLLQVIGRLEENLFAIPGYDLELEGHKDHNHDHTNIALSVEEIYQVQEELLKALNQIQTILRKS